LRDSGGLFRQLMEAAPDAMVVVRGDGCIAFANGRAEALFGYAHGELLGEPIEILIPDRFRGGHPAHRAAHAVEPRLRAMAANLALHGQRKDGTEVPVEINLSSLCTAEETLITATIRDSTDRRAIDERLRQAEERYRMLLDNFPNGGVIMFDHDLRYTLVRGSSFEEVGLVAGMEGKTVWEALAPDAAAHAEPVMRDLLDGNPSVAEVAYGGRTYLVHRAPVRERGKVTGGLLLAQDITPRVEAEEALRQSEARYRLLFEKAGEAIYLVQAEGSGIGTIVEANESAAAIHGYTVAEMMGKHVTDLLPEGAAAGAAGGLQGVLDSGWTAGEGVHVRKYGAPFPIDWSAGPLGASGQRGVLVFLRDITERKQAIESLREARDAAESASRELETFSYAVAHELRAPLRGMSSFAQVLLDDYEDKLDAEGVDCLHEIHANAGKMAALIDAFLALSRLSRSEVQRERVDLAVVGRAVLVELAAADTARHVDLVVGDGLYADVDPALARALLHGLLVNAWKFTSRTPAARIELGTTGRDTFFVRDNGAGFDMAYAAKLFVPFQRLHAVADFPGAGIGLATAQRIVSRHAGRIWAEGAAGAGATFYFTLVSPAPEEIQ
jgi:PAS domain S-box-containing protein